jgi:hypothetical protein
MRRFLKVILVIGFVLVLLAPVAIAITFFMMPLWLWVELHYQIESAGHSGPAEWCFLATYVVLAALCLSTLALLFVTHPKRQRSSPRDE